MTPGDSDAIRAERETMKARLARLALKYADEYPDLLQNYTLAMLLYVREYEHAGVLDNGHRALTRMIEAASERRLVNFTSLHRAITATKRDFQTPEQRKRGLEQEEAYAESFRVGGEGWDL